LIGLKRHRLAAQPPPRVSSVLAVAYGTPVTMNPTARFYFFYFFGFFRPWAERVERRA
jgi:hypothetical protein